jgi:GNAT superfamily N-acetyltransferase
MTKHDLQAINALQLKAFAPHFHESLESFAAKLAFYPKGAWVAAEGAEILGYLFSHPWRFGIPVPLNVREFPTNLSPDCYYLHEITVAASHRGQGLAAAFIAKGESLAKDLGLSRLAMISVQGSRDIWEKFGYTLTIPAPAHQEKLQIYGPDAVYLTKTL